ncbi:MAG: hypothetical protein WC365_03690 [Candidatus Babeliales bacterium]|jgi:hypothetical protein
MVKLTDKQKEVIKLMANGWELGLDIGLTGRYWMQQGGCGRGGESKNIHANTIYFLNHKKLIKSTKREFPLEHFELTETGKEIATIL